MRKLCTTQYYFTEVRLFQNFVFSDRISTAHKNEKARPMSEILSKLTMKTSF